MCMGGLSICQMTSNTSPLNLLHHFRLADNHRRAKRSQRHRGRYVDREGGAQNEWMSDRKGGEKATERSMGRDRERGREGEKERRRENKWICVD